MKEKILGRAGENWFWMLVYGLIFAYFVARYCWLPTDPTFGAWSRFKQVIGLPLLILLSAVFVNIFSNPIPLPPAEGLSDDEKAEKLESNRQQMNMQRRNWMIFTYSFMLFALMVPIYFFSAGWNNSNNQQVAAPLAVFVGCSLDNEKNKEFELSCFPETKPEAQKDQSDKNQAASKSKGGTQTQPEPAQVTTVPARSAWVLNLGGYVTNSSQFNPAIGHPAIYQVRGGLLVPLYVIILALMGGSISLTRRLPEFQKSANPVYVSTEKEPKLTQHEFREYLIFQIVQFISAPLIAILAYYLVEPSTIQASAALAFTAGFASESILLMVRSVSEKITPTSATTTQKTGTITGIVTLDNETGQRLENAEISFASSSQIRAKTDKSGFYILNNVPVGEHGVEVSKAGYEKKSETVKIERAQEVVSHHWQIKKAADKAANNVQT